MCVGGARDADWWPRRPHRQPLGDLGLKNSPVCVGGARDAVLDHLQAGGHAVPIVTDSLATEV